MTVSILVFLGIFVLTAIVIWSDDISIHNNTHDDPKHGK